MENLITKKSVKFTDKGVKGHMKLKDGSVTNFTINNDGEIKQWGENADANQSITTPVLTDILVMLYSEE
jgi:hypothetical protein